MSSGFEAGSDDGIHASLLKCSTLFGCGRRANRDDVFRPALLQDFLWWDSVDEAEHRYLFVQQDASLILKSSPRIRFVLWTRRSQGCDMDSKWRKASVERVFIRCSSTFVFHRYPQVHCERFRCKGTNLCDRVFDRSRCQAMSTERSESTKVGNRCRQLLGRQSAKRALDDGIVDPEFRGEPILIPARR